MYLSIKIYGDPNWKDYIYDTATKVNTANALLYKIRNYVDFHTSKKINILLNYVNPVCGQNLNSIVRTIAPQEKP